MPLYTTRTTFWSQCGRFATFVPGGSNTLVLATTQTVNYSFSDPDWVAFHCDTALAASGGPSCARQFCASLVPRYGYPWMCATGVGPGAGAPAGMAAQCLFYSVAWPGATVSGQPDRAHRNCEQTPCGDATSGYTNLQTNWECECLYCGVGSNVAYDPASNLCYECPAGMCYCASVGDCINCSPPPCAAQLSCYWDTQGCAWHCDTPTCPAGEAWSSTDCQCHTSTPPPPPPPCATELGCTLDTGSNTWVCTGDPATICPAGYHWDWTTCSCVTNCATAGTCWCNSGSCVDCSHHPDCFVERSCHWDMDLCRYVCTEPTCDPGYHFSYNGCICRPDHSDETPWLIQAPPHWHEQTLARDGQIHYQRIQDPVPSLPLPYDAAVAAVPEHGTDTHPRMVVDWAGNRVLVFHREIVSPGVPSSQTMLTTSDDDGDTWSDPVAFIPGTSFNTISGDADTPLMIAAARDNTTGKIKARKRWRGDTAWGPVYTLQVDNGAGTLVDLVLDATSFHLVVAGETSGRGTLHGCQGGDSELFLASDDYETWEKVS